MDTESKLFLVGWCFVGLGFLASGVSLLLAVVATIFGWI